MFRERIIRTIRLTYLYTSYFYEYIIYDDPNIHNKNL